MIIGAGTLLGIASIGLYVKDESKAKGHVRNKRGHPVGNQ
jgi:hypothetical protein